MDTSKLKVKQERLASGTYQVGIYYGRDDKVGKIKVFK